MPVAEIPVSVTVSRKDGSARIQWAEGSDADLQRVVQLLIRAGEMVLAYEKTGRSCNCDPAPWNNYRPDYNTKENKKQWQTEI